MKFLEQEESTANIGFSFQAGDAVSDREAEYKAEMIQVALPQQVDPYEVKNKLLFDGDDSVYRRSLQEQDAATFDKYRLELMDEALQDKDQDGYLDAGFIEPVKMARNVETILEDQYGKKILDTVEVVFGEDILSKAESSNEGFAEYDNARSFAENALFNQTIGRELAVKYEEQDTSNPLSDVFDFSVNAFLPFYQGADLSNVVSEDFDRKFFETTGKNVQRQINYIMSISDQAERKRVLQETVDKISLLDNKQEFIRSWLNNSSYNADELTLFTDVADLATIGTSKLALKGMKGLYGTVVKALGRPDPTKAVAEALAEAPGAVASSLARNSDPKIPLPAREAGEVADLLPSVYNDARRLTGSETLTQGAQIAIREHESPVMKEALEKLMSEGSGAQRQSPLDLLEDVKQTLDEIRADFGGVRVLDVVPEQQISYVAPTNTYRANLFLGRQNGEAFKTEEAAQAYAKDFVGIKTSDYEVVQDAASQKWMIKVTRDVDEQRGFQASLKDAPIEADEMFSTSKTTAIVGRLMSTAASEGKGLQGAKLRAIHGAQDWWSTFEHIAAPYFKLRKEEGEEMIRILEHTQGRKDVRTGMNPGWYDTAEDFELAFHMINGKNPTEAQHQAYWAYRQAMDVSKALMETSRLATYIRLGGRRIEIPLRNDKGKKLLENIHASTVANKEEFAKEWVRGGKYARVAIVDDKGKVKMSSTKKGDDMLEIMDDKYDIFWTLEKSGATVGGKKRANFIAVPKGGYSKHNLTLKDTSAGYAGGHHMIYENPYFVKLGKFDEDMVYSGDSVLVNAFSMEQAKRIADNWNEATRKFLNGDIAGARIMIEGEKTKKIPAKLPFLTWDEFVANMKNAADDIPAVAARAGTTWVDNAPNLEKISRLTIPDARLDRLADLERSFSESRLATDLRVMREEANGVWKVESAPKMDPTKALQAGLQKSISARMVKDSLVRGVRTWAKQFGDQTKWSMDRIYSDPIGFITADPKDLYTANAYRNQLDGWFSNMEAARNALARQIETGTATSRFTSYINERIHERFFGKGQKPLKPFEWARTKDPIAFARSVAYDVYLGLWNIQQIAVQMSSTAIAASINPGVYAQAIPAAMALKSTMYSSKKAIHLHFGKHFSKFSGLKAEEFAQMAEDLRTRGWSHMGGTMAQIADDVTGSVLQGKTQKALEWGRVIPQSIDRFHRHTGWAMAWIEAKKKLGKTKFNAAELEQILARANTISMNMSAANNAAWQRGIFAPAAQFTTYPLRVMEEVMGGLTGNGNLSKKEAIQVLVGQAALFGLPSGALGTMFGPVSPINFKEFFSKAAIEQGWDINEGALEAFNDGLLSTLTEYFTGEDVDFERMSLGQEGIPAKLFNEGMTFSFLSGPGGSALLDLTTGVTKAMRNAFYAEADDVYGVLASDLELAARSISSLDVGFKLRDIIQRGVWTNRKGEAQTEVGELEGILTMLAAAKPAEVSQAQLLREIMYDRKGSRQDTAKIAKEFYKRGINAKNPEDRRAFWALAKHFGYSDGMSPGELLNTLKRAQEESQVSTDAMIEKFRVDQLRHEQRKARRESY